HVDDVAIDIDGHQTPDIDARSILPAFALPRVVKGFARARHGMEGPDQLAIVHIERPYIPGRSLRRPFLRPSADDDQVLEHDRRRTEAVAAWQSLQNLRRVEIDDTCHAESVAWLARHRVNRIELAVRRA